MTGVLSAVNGSPGRVAATSPHRSASPAASVTPPAASSPAPAGPASPFRYTGTGNIQTSSFDCVTAAVCYAWFTGNAGNGPNERTSHGGATWQQLAGLPGGLVLTNQVQPSCPTTQVCFAATGSLTLAVTTDAGTSWRLDRLPAPAGGSGDGVDQVSCATARQCVVHVTSGQSGTFLSTGDGGQSWTAASAVPANAPGSLYYLRCDQNADCIGVYPAGGGG